MSERSKKTTAQEIESEDGIVLEECIEGVAMPLINIEGNVYIGYSADEIVKMLKGISELPGMSASE